jgi:16S rRNA (guanine966-N2)-methyltransferase
VTFADIALIRPTPNRIRETLFNWLAPHLSGALCFEPFAGSGILSMEALSRGAERVLIIDQSQQVIEHIRCQMENFTAPDADYTLHCEDALTWIRSNRARESFDVVFLDPPFSEALVTTSCHLLSEYQLLADGALVYIESESAIVEAALPVNWSIHRQKKAASVHYCVCTTG